MKALMRSLVLTAVVLVAGCGYNTIQTYDEQVNVAESQIKVQLQRRADLIPNLVQTVKGYAKQEQTIFTAVADARARLAGAVQSGDLQQMADANRALTAPLGRLIAIAENSAAQVERELPCPAGPARGHGEPHRGRAPGLQRGGKPL